MANRAQSCKNAGSAFERFKTRCAHAGAARRDQPSRQAAAYIPEQRESKPRDAVLESARTQEICMIWLLTGLLSVALIIMSLRIGAWLLLKYDTGGHRD